MEKRLATLPNPLISLNGQKIESADQWQKNRRDEVLDLFREHIYGREPLQPLHSLDFTVRSNQKILNGRADQKQVEITYQGQGGQGSFPVTLVLPADADQAVPVFLLINIAGEEFADPTKNDTYTPWPAEYILSRGYGAAIFQVGDVDPDHDDGFKNGVHGILDAPQQPRPSNAWATISAWAWGASRVMDYFKTDPEVDDQHVALVGHSRGGKAALWAGALDQRFAMVVSNNSGSTGAAISRGKIGEKIKDINTRFNHWFTENYKKYNDREDELPVDQHMLLALIAPRLLYVSSATEDSWADPESEFLSVTLSAPVYQLFGFDGINKQTFPMPDSPIFGGNVGYHLRTGAHKLTQYDWKCFIDFADRNL